jgi:hypothetical protein
MDWARTLDQAVVSRLMVADLLIRSLPPMRLP